MADRSARELAFAALREWRTSSSFADAILARLLISTALSTRDRAFVTELFYGVLRNLILLDFWIDTLRAEGLDPDARDLLRLGIYQIFLLRLPEHAAVFETVAVAPRRARALVNAILRTALRQQAELMEKASQQSLALRTSHPPFLVDRWTRHFGAENIAALCEWNNRPAPIYARINVLKISVEDFLSKCPGAEPVPGQEDFALMSELPREALARGHCYVQDPSTAAACQLLDARPGERVLDACAAPGGKTAYLAQKMNNLGTIAACDRDVMRLGGLEENLKRLGVTIAEFFHHDWISEPAPPALTAARPFDRILIDAPCSNTGVMRRRVDLRWRLTVKDFPRMHQQQLQIVRATIPLLKSGGVLVYSTCSLEPEENERVVEAVRQEFPFMERAGEKFSVPFRDGLDGAFAARLIRTE